MLFSDYSQYDAERIKMSDEGDSVEPEVVDRDDAESGGDEEEEEEEEEEEDEDEEEDMYGEIVRRWQMLPSFKFRF